MITRRLIIGKINNRRRFEQARGERRTSIEEKEEVNPHLETLLDILLSAEGDQHIDGEAREKWEILEEGNEGMRKMQKPMKRNFALEKSKSRAPY